MALYSKFWEGILKQYIEDKAGLTGAVDRIYKATGLNQIGDRDKNSYNGSLEIFAGSVGKHTNSQFFRDLAKVISSSGYIGESLSGLLNARVSGDDSISLTHTPFSYELMINRYRDYQDQTQMKEELYKWELVKEFQDLWAQYESKRLSFAQFFEKTNFGNLIYFGTLNTFKLINKKVPHEFEIIILRLYDESISLQTRIEDFSDSFVKLYISLKTPPPNNHFLDERAISSLLSFRYPEKYTFYKRSYYDVLINCLHQTSPGSWKKLVHFNSIVDDFKANVLPHYQDVIAVKNRLTNNEKYYQDNQHLLLIQDIFYLALSKNIKEETDSEKTTEKFMQAKQSLQNIKMAGNLNQILFGPPGTGKTYHSINHAVSIVEEKSIEDIINEKRADVLARFNEYKHKGIIEFVTFHQSFSYEDFIEGIKPEMEDPEENEELKSKELRYEIVSGIFKEVCENARSYQEYQQNETPRKIQIPKEILDKAGFYKVSLGNSQLTEGELIYNYCMEHNCIAIGWGRDVDYTGVKNRQEIHNKYVDAGYVAEANDFNVSAVERLILWMKKGDIVFISNGSKTLRAIGIVDGDYEYIPEEKGVFRYSHYRKVKWLYKDLDIPVKEFYEATFSQQSIYGMYHQKINKAFFTDKETIKKPIRKNHVLIIDEINRGNVSQIFGELITLIEEDKREGNRNEMSVTLPYSKEKFSVPSNLYIIGTMNTADRSVEALDTALRRRFSFIEMPPIYDLPELEMVVLTTKLTEILLTMNKRIEKLLGKDNLIGHAYFMDVHGEVDLKSVFQDKIIPLLQEYFFGDYSKIGLVLGRGFIELKEIKPSRDLFADFHHDSKDELLERPTWKIADVKAMSPDEFSEAIDLLMRKPKTTLSEEVN